MRRTTCQCTRAVLFSYVNTFVEFILITQFLHRNQGERSETAHFLLWFIQQKAVFVLIEEKSVHNMQPNYSFLFVRKVVHISWIHICKVLNAISTDLNIKNNQLQYPLQSTISGLDTRKSAILATLERKH